MPYRVLIADDAAPIRARIAGLLSELDGVTVCGEAVGGSDALASIELLRPDVVILDIQMPDGNGFRVLEHVGTLDRKPRVIVCTNYPYPQYRQRAMNLGATEFLDKAKELLRIGELIGAWSRETKA